VAVSLNEDGKSLAYPMKPLSIAGSGRNLYPVFERIADVNEFVIKPLS